MVTGTRMYIYTSNYLIEVTEIPILPAILYALARYTYLRQGVIQDNNLRHDGIREQYGTNTEMFYIRFYGYIKHTNKPSVNQIYIHR